LSSVMMDEEDMQEHQQHPMCYIFVGRRSFFLLSVIDVVHLRATCTSLRDVFGASQLRQRLSHSLGRQRGLRRVRNGQAVPLLVFDAQHMGEAELLVAMFVLEEGGWGEMSEAIELAASCGYCHLPVRLDGSDLHHYDNKTAYLADPRVLAQLRMVGPHIHFGGGVTFEVFQAGERMRMIKNQRDFQLTIGPPIPPDHLYQQHRQEHDPPVRSEIGYSPDRGYWTSVGASTYSSASSFIKSVIMAPFARTRARQSNSSSRNINRHVDDHRLHTLLTQSPHSLVEGCSTSVSYFWPRYGKARRVVLTDTSHEFVAWVSIWDCHIGDANDVKVQVFTTERPATASSSDPFRERFPVTTRLARAALGRVVAALMFDR